jgi:hypothetical protein
LSTVAEHWDVVYWTQMIDTRNDTKGRPTMMHPDQMYTLRQLRHEELRAEVEWERAGTKAERKAGRTAGMWQMLGRLLAWVWPQGQAAAPTTIAPEERFGH